jgi:hypothetical protein
MSFIVNNLQDKKRRKSEVSPGNFPSAEYPFEQYGPVPLPRSCLAYLDCARGEAMICKKAARDEDFVLQSGTGEVPSSKRVFAVAFHLREKPRSEGGSGVLQFWEPLECSYKNELSS